MVDWDYFKELRKAEEQETRHEKIINSSLVCPYGNKIEKDCKSEN